MLDIRQAVKSPQTQKYKTNVELKKIGVYCWFEEGWMHGAFDMNVIRLLLLSYLDNIQFIQGQNVCSMLRC